MIYSQQYSSGFFEFEIPATMQKRHNLLDAVKKLTREVTTLGRERIKEKEKGDGQIIIFQVYIE